LFARFPSLADLPRVALGTAPTPVVPLVAGNRSLWVKRDDLFADPIGGNKARALEFLLGGIRQGDRVVTVGSAGSTHALSVATYGGALGASVYVGRWQQEMNDAAVRVASRIDRVAASAPVFRSPVGAYLWAMRRRVAGARWIPAGGSTPLGILGHVNAGLELVGQIEAGLLLQPANVVVPLGTGGTAAGIALAFAIAEQPIHVIGARVVPRLVARESRVRRLANQAASLIERIGKTRVARLQRGAISVAHGVFGGAYGRATTEGRDAARVARDAAGIILDPTYSAKAFAHALTIAENASTLFWLTFDSRTIDRHDQTA
jgi:D-cysteine desulfhydrase